MEENGNGKEKPEFKYFTRLMFNDETGAYSFETNVPNSIIGYGMLEFGKKGIDNHILKAQQNKVVGAPGGIMNFARKVMR